MFSQLPIGYSGSRSFNLTVIGRDSQTLDNLFMESTTDFDFKSKSVSILIQTDKAIYQPGQKSRSEITSYENTCCFVKNKSYK